jgi:cysteine-rich repeat protein
MRMQLLAAALAVTTVGAASARAFAPTAEIVERAVEPATGARSRAYRPVSDRTPAAAARPWQRLAAELGAVGTQWDDDTGVPLRMWGAGIAAPGAIADAAIAAASARRVLDAHLDLLAPGAGPADFTELANLARAGVRTVVFQQRWRGLPVLGGRIEFTFKVDHLIALGSTALPHVHGDDGAAALDRAHARARAGQAIADAYGGVPEVGELGPPLILPIVRDSGRVDYHRVVPVEVALAAPVGRWDVYVDTATGAVVARHQKLLFATGALAYHVPVRWPGAAHFDAPAVLAHHVVDGTPTTADQDGVFAWPGEAAATVTPGVTGTLVAVASAAGALVPPALSVAPNATAIWDASAVEDDDAQLDAYIHANLAKAYVRAHIDPNLAYLDQQLPVFVNENNTCNANSSGDDLHFYRSGNGCENTGRIADIVYHEFGHSVHYHALIGGGTPDDSLGEGQADYLAMTITNDSGVGRGFFFTNDPIREANPVGTELRWPDDINANVHLTGMIFSGTMWDLRAALIDQYGAAAGVARADALYYGIIQRASDIPSTYVEALVQDDDDGNLANGTPNLCLIQTHFAHHGLVPNPHVPVIDGTTIRVPITATSGAPGCGLPDVSGGTVTWQVRGTPAAGGTIEMSQVGPDFVAEIPHQVDGTVVQYRIDTRFPDGTTTTLPFNPADPMYELFMGPITPIQCWDFETAPTDWTHAASLGTDEWTWGVPAGTNANGDPRSAASGTHVFGVDLGTTGGDGLYESRTNQVATTPVVDVRGYVGVRLQYQRWLNVEDGHFDHATIAADGTTLWQNADSNQGMNSKVAHRDREWRFQDVDLSAAAVDGKVQVAFGLTSDGNLQFGGWTLDDVCIVGYVPGAPICGDRIVGGAEQCDDGNTLAHDGCSPTCTMEYPIDPMPTPDGCCSAGGAPGGSAALGAAVAILFRRRRRRA